MATQVVMNNTTTNQATPDVIVAGLIGAAQAGLSLGITSTVPGGQSAQDGLSQLASAKQIPAAQVTAVQAYLKTPQCATTISDARAVATYTVAKFKQQSVVPVAPVATPVTPTTGPAAPITRAPTAPAPRPVQSPPAPQPMGGFRAPAHGLRANAVLASPALPQLSSQVTDAQIVAAATAALQIALRQQTSLGNSKKVLTESEFTQDLADILGDWINEEYPGLGDLIKEGPDLSQTLLGDDSGFYSPLGLLFVTYLFPPEPTVPQMPEIPTNDPIEPVEVTVPDGPMDSGSPNPDDGSVDKPEQN